MACDSKCACCKKKPTKAKKGKAKAKPSAPRHRMVNIAVIPATNLWKQGLVATDSIGGMVKQFKSMATQTNNIEEVLRPVVKKVAERVIPNEYNEPLASRPSANTARVKELAEGLGETRSALTMKEAMRLRREEQVQGGTGEARTETVHPPYTPKRTPGRLSPVSGSGALSTEGRMSREVVSHMIPQGNYLEEEGQYNIGRKNVREQTHKKVMEFLGKNR